MIYRLESENLEAIFINGKLYVQTGIHRFSMISGDEDTGFAVGELEFHNVSETPTSN